MSRVCSICGKGQASGNNVSHSNRKTRRTFKVNVQKVSFIQDGKEQSGYVCARCLKEVVTPVRLKVTAVIKDEETEEDSADTFYLDGNLADVDEIIVNAFVLGTEERFLCREDCKGLCPKCGADLNDGPCNCKAEIDPRLAVLGQLLEND